MAIVLYPEALKSLIDNTTNLIDYTILKVGGQNVTGQNLSRQNVTEHNATLTICHRTHSARKNSRG